ncbi:hypothetical protein ACFS5L_25275 [Streptomyces phyllanthi]|uniref:Uncharacterized protein n=1 Tax=Streptomyces phyllanthi TaxID=1803180 RepID=A0A5N8W551_9ACTN|nr:hypothetical protein [Streptomyces phyllanthi]MPY41444.1 hypothetical protein [Streptomyces phyllanthi]
MAGAFRDLIPGRDDGGVDQHCLASDVFFHLWNGGAPGAESFRETCTFTPEGLRRCPGSGALC